MTQQFQTDAALIANRQLQGDYHQLDMTAPDIARHAQPGQFIHLMVPSLEHRILRRPFSIYDTDPETGRVSIVYKKVGTGTDRLAQTAEPGTAINLLGPLGVPFQQPRGENSPRLVIVAGGYGCAATFLLAKNATVKPTVLIGGRNTIDILLVREYQKLGCNVRVSTDDGSEGTKGLVTKLLMDELQRDPNVTLAACGPNPMLKAVANIAVPRNIPAQISLDQPMCCGIGACFACVIKVIDKTNADGWRYSRSCKEGPVYDARDIYWD